MINNSNYHLFLRQTEILRTTKFAFVDFNIKLGNHFKNHKLPRIKTFSFHFPRVVFKSAFF